MEKKRKPYYVNSAELEEWWTGWLMTGDPHAWKEMSDRIYKICSGIAIKFSPKNEEEHAEHVHDAFTQTLEKIRLGKLKFIRGKAPVFNLITTTVYNILYSKMNKIKKQKDHQKKYAYRFVQEHAPELLEHVEFPYQKVENAST